MEKYIYSSLSYIYMADNKIQLPSSMGGLVRYFDEFKSKIEFKPGYVILFIVIVILLEFLLHSQSARFLG